MTETNHEVTISYRTATEADFSVLAKLINSAYRGEASKVAWASEADLVDGARITIDGLRKLMAEPHSVILLCERDGNIIGCVNLKKTGQTAYLGMFAVQATLQGNGIGRQFLLRAEQYVRETWGVNKVWLTVIVLRQELVAYYERRGYRRTGQFHPFPQDAGSNVPRVEGLQIEVLEKILE